MGVITDLSHRLRFFFLFAIRYPNGYNRMPKIAFAPLRSYKGGPRGDFVCII